MIYLKIDKKSSDVLFLTLVILVHDIRMH